ncbi:unnamed protein product [Acanthoscelides obtectus]|uniref:MADF domain-containing protein n=1 Tax=Acanthoscelides obtectus TaxID=200917 RepID=A0A9P0KJ13_ACAOB|nr:unnamed protein product [Acanthoscelides obtectus]CAK1642536.1 hypothetical protein AOBTE_LOCUS13104 [Acanthoscelides obtectus]
MAKKFKYDIYSSIEIIESKECLWDKTKEVSKDKVLRRNAWRDVCAFLEPNFEDMDQKNKDEIILPPVFIVYLPLWFKMPRHALFSNSEMHELVDVMFNCIQIGGSQILNYLKTFTRDLERLVHSCQNGILDVQIDIMWK